MIYHATVAVAIASALPLLYSVFKIQKQKLQHLHKLLYLEDGSPRIFGHRAGQFEAPENTLVAMETAAVNGASAVEIDLEFTSDGVPVIFHDDVVDRVTDSHGAVGNHTYDELVKLNAAYVTNYTLIKEGKTHVPFERIPTLVEAVRKAKQHELVIDLDVKSGSNQICKALKTIQNEFPDAPEFIFVTSFYPNIIYQIRLGCPEFFVGFIWRYHYLSRTIAGVPRYSWYLTPVMDALDKLSEMVVHSVLTDFLGVSLVVMHKDHLSKRYIDAWRSKDVQVLAWTVNHPLEKEYLMKIHQVPIVTDSLLNSEDCAEQTG